MENHELIPAEEFCIHHHVEMNFLYSLREYGLTELISNEGHDYVSAEGLNELEKITRLHHELNVNMEGIDVILNLLKQLEDTQKEIGELRNQLRFYHS